MVRYDTVIIGGGAAGFYAALHLAEKHPDRKILILEKNNQVLNKVRVSGGGRCNVTHIEINPTSFSKNYPGGSAFLKQAFKKHGSAEVQAWFSQQGLYLNAEPDGRLFPQSNRSESVIAMFLDLARTYGMLWKTLQEVVSVNGTSGRFEIQTKTDSFQAKQILVAVGGYAKPSAYAWLEALGHTFVYPVPSLFTFNDPRKKYVSLMGIAQEDVVLRIEGHKLEQRGPVLITHWGFSGPAVLKLSAFLARDLFEKEYKCTLLIRWIPDASHESLFEEMKQMQLKHPKKKVYNQSLGNLTQRLWCFLVDEAGISSESIWEQLSHKSLNKLIETLLHTQVPIEGKTTFKEEFVTSGGIPLDEISSQTMESLKTPGLFFAGEILDIDGITGGYNFQAAWTTGYLAAEGMAV